MAAITVTYTFSNGTTADATQVNTNFTDILNGLSDGTKDISIGALTVATTATLTGVASFAAQLRSALGSVSAPAYSFTGDLNTGMYSSGADALELVTNGVTRVALGTSGTLGNTSYAFSMYGIRSGASPAAGTIGEYTEAVQSTATNTSGNNVWGDGASLSITAGEWELSASCDFSLGTASSVSAVLLGISTTSGNSATGLTFGYNAFSAPGPTASADTPLWIPCYRVSVSSTTTYYLKIKANFTAGGGNFPQSAFVIRARRVG